MRIQNKLLSELAETIKHERTALVSSVTGIGTTPIKTFMVDEEITLRTLRKLIQNIKPDYKVEVILKPIQASELEEKIFATLTKYWNDKVKDKLFLLISQNKSESSLSEDIDPIQLEIMFNQLTTLIEPKVDPSSFTLDDDDINNINLDNLDDFDDLSDIKL